MGTKKLKPETILARPYRRVVIPDPETGTYTGLVQELPGCVAQGSSIEEVHARLEAAALAWIEAAADLGQDVPAPHEDSQLSGRFALRMPAGLHRTASEHAAREGVSVNQFIVAAVAERVGAKNLYVELARELGRQLTASTQTTARVIAKILFSQAILRTAATPPNVSRGIFAVAPGADEVN